MKQWWLGLLVLGIGAAKPAAQGPTAVDWATVEAETLRHFQALVRMDTSDPPGGEKPAADYVKAVLERTSTDAARWTTRTT
jgi:hypothetical protein